VRLFALGGLFITLSLGWAVIGCQSEQRDLHPTAAASATSSGVIVGELQPGEGVPPGIAATLAEAQENAYAMNEGKRLFESYNCSGCHAHGGGSIGPALMDSRWIYGSQPANIFATIVEGRPNGMPSFRGKVPDIQVAQLVAYVRAMAGLAATKSAPGRDDAMHVVPDENTRDSAPVVQEASPSP
jgi:cytochrome c oxidase cbb3-type subunit 3